MAVATYTSNLLDIALFEDTSGITAYGGGGAGLSADPDFVMEGTNSVNKEVDAADKGFLFGAASAFVLGDHNHLYVWIMGSTPGLHETRDAGGIHVDIGDSNTAFVKFHVDGFDTLPFGGGTPYAVRFVNTALTNFRTLLGSPGTAPDSIGGGITTTATVMGPNLGVDAARIGSAYTVLFGTSADPEATFDGIATNDDSTSEGVFQPTSGGFNLQGKLRIGNGVSECELLDSNVSIFILDTLHSLEDFSEILVAHESSILTLTNVTFTAIAGRQQTVAGNNPNRGRLEMLTPIIDAQDETSYDNSPTTEGTFVGGTGHVAADVLTMSDSTLITVDTVDGGGIVLTFTVNSIAIAAEARSSVAGTANTQVSSDGPGIDFTLTPDVDNLRTTPTVTATGVGFIGFGETLLDTGATMDTCRWVGANQITANGATFTDSTVEGFEDQIITDAQDETSYDSSPSTEGSFVGGTGHVAADILTMSDGTLITVDTEVGGVVTEFTVDSSGAVASRTAVANTQLTSDGPGVVFTLTPLIDNLDEVAAFKWEDNLDPNGETDGMTFTKGTNPTHAMEFGVNSPLSMTLTDVTFTSYSVVEGDIDTALWFRRTSGTITLGISGGTTPSFKTDGATVVITNAVTVRVEGVTEGAAVSVLSDETVGTQRIGDIIFEQLADSSGVAQIADFNFEGAFGAGLDVKARARQSGVPNGAQVSDNGVFTDFTPETNTSTLGFANSFDGANDFFNRGATLTGLVDGKLGYINCWFRRAGTGIEAIWRDDVSNARLTLSFSVVDILSVFGRSSGGGTRLDLRANTAITDTDWHHLIVSWDLNTAATAFFYVDDVDETNSVSHVDADLDLATNPVDWGLGARPDTGASKYTGEIAEFIFDPTYVAINDTKTRREFITANGTPAYVGADGSLPSGTAVMVYFGGSNRFSDFNTNRGTGGPFTVNGALTDGGNVTDTNMYPATPVIDQDSFYFGHAEQSSGVKLHLVVAATGSPTITPQYWDGDSWEPLTGVVDDTTDLTVLGENKITWTLPGDWATSTEGGLGPFFWMRLLFDAGTMTVNPELRKAVLDVDRYLPFTRDAEVTSSGVTVVASWVLDDIGQF